MMADITAIVLTKNEEVNLTDCLASIAGFASRVVVVDSGSTDRTEEIARSGGAEFVFHAFTYHAAQFNWALDNIDIRTKWVMRIDADERLTEDNRREALAIIEKDDENVTGIVMQADFYLLGRAIRHGMNKKRKIVLFRNGCGRSEDRLIDEHMLLLKGESREISSHFEHRDAKDLADFVRKLTWYAGREADDRLSERDRDQLPDASLMRTSRLKDKLYYRCPPYIRSWLLFVYSYIFRLGFLDGIPGLVYQYLYCRFYRFLVDATLYEKRSDKKKSGERGR